LATVCPPNVERDRRACTKIRLFSVQTVRQPAYCLLKRLIYRVVD